MIIAHKTNRTCLWASISLVGLLLGSGCQILTSRKSTATASKNTARDEFTVPLTVTKAFAPYRIQINDTLMIALRGITPEQPNLEMIVDEKGDIKLPYINTVKAEGSTASELEDAIRRTYLAHKIYRNITVNVIIPSQVTPAPTFYIKGEVHTPGRIPFVNGMTVLSAVAAAGGPTDYFSPDMILVRGSQKIKINYHDIEKHPDHDQPIQSGDVIIVEKSWF